MTRPPAQKLLFRLHGKNKLNICDNPKYVQAGDTVVDPDAWLEHAKQGRYLPEDHMRALMSLVRERLIVLPNVVELSSPMVVCGDIHGQFFDLQVLLEKSGGPPNVKLLFLGDYVDRGRYSLETITLLFCMLVKYPDHVTLLRGNHETRRISQVYGFYAEIEKKYGGVAIWRECCDTFDLLPIGAKIDDRVMAVHGGLSPDIRSVDGIQELRRAMEVPEGGPVCDILWSDPEESIKHWSQSSRGAGFNFGVQPVEDFLWANNLDLICRSHQLVEAGFKYYFDKKLCTIWSAPNYCNMHQNRGAFLKLDPHAEITHVKFDSDPDHHEEQWPIKDPSPYFL